MSSKLKYSKKKFGVLSIFLLLLATLLIFVYLKKENYLNCLKIDLQMCLTSRMYVSSNGFNFRFPKDFPVSYIEKDKLSKIYGITKYEEWINFSDEFYPNAGGDRLGSVIVTLNSESLDLEKYKQKVLS